MKIISHHLSAPKAPAALGSLARVEMAWNEASGELVSPRAKEDMGGIVRIKGMSLEYHSSLHP
jgi:hypothetical protein